MKDFLTNFYSCKIIKPLPDNLVLVDVNLGFHINIAACLRLNDEDYDRIHNIRKSAYFIIDGVSDYEENITPSHIFLAKIIDNYDYRKDRIFYRCNLTRVCGPKHMMLIVKLGYWVRKLVKVSLKGIPKDIEQCNLFDYDLKAKVMQETLFVTFGREGTNNYDPKNASCVIYNKFGECLNDWIIGQI